MKPLAVQSPSPTMLIPPTDETGTLLGRSSNPRVNELLTPASCFSPTAILSFLSYSRKLSDDRLATQLPRDKSCKDYITTTLFPAWLDRDTILVYCESVASSGSTGETPDAPHTPIDPRVDSYGARDADRKSSSSADYVGQWVEREREAEAIIRKHSAGVLAARCGSFATQPISYLNAYRESA